MRNLSGIWRGNTPGRVVWVGIAAAVVAILTGTAAAPRIVSANQVDPPNRPIVFCDDDVMGVLWSTGNDGEAEAPEGWKIERRRWNSGSWIVQTFTVLGDQAHAILTPNRDSWLWEDGSIDPNSPYTYRVRAINADGSDTEGRTWSERGLSDCLKDPSGQPGLSFPRQQVDGLSMLWRTRNHAQTEAPDGWKVERRNLDSEANPVVQTFTFIGADAGALLTVDDRYWGWVDTSAEREVEYTYRVRAINADGSDLEGRIWSRDASGMRQAQFLDQPGISVPKRQATGVRMFWHTANRGQADPPDGWKVERRHRDPAGNWMVKTFVFIGVEADALQTHNEQYWDWVDTSAGPDVAYTYRVRAIDADGSNTEGRLWSRRASVE